MKFINCKICDNTSNVELKDRPDFEFGITYKLDYYKCGNKECGHVFSSPNPDISTISSFYKEYTTHDSPKNRNLIEKIIYSIRKISVIKFTNDFSKDATILDYGCGNGYYSFLLSELSFNNILAFDFDENTRKPFEHSSIKFITNELEISSKKYDIILLNHVIEHIVNPKELLQKLYLLLNDGGIIYLRTPNNNSICSSVFEKFWRGWETPRHLNIFSYNSFNFLLKDYSKSQLKTSNQMFLGIFMASFNYKYKKNRIFQILFGVYCFMLSTLSNNKKEEIVCKIFK